MIRTFTKEQDIADFRTRVGSIPLLPYDDLDTSPSSNLKHVNTLVNDILDNGWERWSHRLPSLQPPLPWHEKRGSFDYALHAWDMLRPFLHAHSLSGDQKYLSIPLQVAEDWLEQNFKPGRTLTENDKRTENARIDKIVKGEQTACWYDMAVGQRIYRLAYILDVAARQKDVANDLIGWLFKALLFHHELLAREDFFREHNNHGIYQALGQLAAARRFAWLGSEHERYFQVAMTRVCQLFDRHFFPSGVHKEHSPGYHYMILGSFRGAARSGLFESRPDVVKRLHAMEKVLGDMIKPDGGLVTFGDTDPRQLVLESSIADRFDEPGLKHILSNGKEGLAPEPGVNFYPDAGYAFARVYAPDMEPMFRNASYLAQMAAFHSRTHKHADHFTFVWHDRQRDILVDPGRYAYASRTKQDSELFRQGFWYADPKRIYVESTRAHNCVEIDNTSYPRGSHMAKPFGSALKYAGEQDGIVVTECETKHFGHVRHWRGLVMAPGHFLLVLDWLYDRRQQIGRHDYRQWFKFHPDWQVEKDGDVIRAFAPEDESRPALSLSAGSLLPGPHLSEIFRGQKEPQLQGWYSDKAYSLVPAASLNFALENTALAQFATLFTFGDVLEIDHAACRVNTTMRAGQFVWTDERGRHELRFDRDHDQHMTVTMESVGKS